MGADHDLRRAPEINCSSRRLQKQKGSAGKGAAFPMLTYSPFTLRSIRVPLSRRTLLPLELITDPAVAEPEAMDDKLRLGMPNTPWLLYVSPPATLAPAPLAVC
jgi:hypothetical protein